MLFFYKVKGLALVFFVYLKVKVWRNLYYFGGFVYVYKVCLYV
jgi:hypothetical protein